LRAQFAYTCYWAYNSTATGVGPETVRFFEEKDQDRYRIELNDRARISSHRPTLADARR
jgi:hypothetical protein